MESIACMPRFICFLIGCHCCSQYSDRIDRSSKPEAIWMRSWPSTKWGTHHTGTHSTSSLSLLLLLLFSKKEQDTIHLDNNNKATTGCSGCALGWHIYICRQCMMSSSISWIQAWLWSSKETQLKARYVRSCNWSSWPCGRICTTLCESSIYWCILKWTIKRSIYYEMTATAKTILSNARFFFQGRTKIPPVATNRVGLL